MLNRKGKIDLVILVSLAGLMVFLLIAFMHTGKQLVPTAPDFDPNQYDGIWVNTHATPNDYTEGCTCTVAIYTLTSNNHILINNKCDKGNETVSILGEATPTDDTHTRYTVKFQTNTIFTPKGDYNILAVAPDYRYAMVGTNERDNLWILSRTRSLDQADYSALLQYAASIGYDITALEPVDQLSCDGTAQ